MTMTMITPGRQEIRDAEERFAEVQRSLRKATQNLDAFAPKSPGQPADYEDRRKLAQDALAQAQKAFEEVGSVEAFAMQLAECRENDPTILARKEFLTSQVNSLRSDLNSALADLQSLEVVDELSYGEVLQKWEALLVAEAALALPTRRYREFLFIARGEPVQFIEDPDATKYARTGFANAVDQLLDRRAARAAKASDADFQAAYAKALNSAPSATQVNEKKKSVGGVS